MPALPSNLPLVRLAASEVHVAQEATLIQTVLGSCVAAALWNPRLKIGAMCHGALPHCPEHLELSLDLTPRLRYVDYSIRYLRERLDALGTRPKELEVKLFGGADVLPASQPRLRDTVGYQNCMAALHAVEECGLRLIVTDLGGAEGRLIYFRSDTGEVFLQRLGSSAASNRHVREELMRVQR